MQQLYGSAYGRRAAAAGLDRGLSPTRREPEDHAEYAGFADAGLPGAAARVLALPLRLPVPRRLRLSRVLSVLGGRALVLWPRAVDRRRTEVPPFPLRLSSRLFSRLRPQFWPKLRRCPRRRGRGRGRTALAETGSIIMSVQAIGQPVRREEDLRLLRGKGRYVDDVREPNEARGYVLRSPHAHARIAEIDTRRAGFLPGVLAILPGEDLRRRGLGTLMPQVRRRRRNGAPAFVCPQPLLARDRVRYVGDPVAFIVAETLDQAKDAAELIDISYEPLPAAISAESALAADAPSVWDENPGKEAVFDEIGEQAADE